MRRVDYKTWLTHGVNWKTIYCFKCMKSDCTLKEHGVYKTELNTKMRIPKKNANNSKRKLFISYLKSFPYYKKGLERVEKWLPFDEEKN